MICIYLSIRHLPSVVRCWKTSESFHLSLFDREVIAVNYDRVGMNGATMNSVMMMFLTKRLMISITVSGIYASSIYDMYNSVRQLIRYIAFFGCKITLQNFNKKPCRPENAEL